MTDTWTWATVTQATPLRIKVDGDTSALDATTGDLVGSLAVDDRVRVHLHSDGIIVTGIQGGGGGAVTNLGYIPARDTDQPGDYPLGISIGYISGNAGTTWPASYATIMTIVPGTPNRTMQTLNSVNSGVSYQRMGASATSWASWYRTDKARDTDWTVYTPTFNTTGTAPDLGNGTIQGIYSRVNNVIHYEIKFSRGTTTTFGSGYLWFSLPITMLGLGAADATNVGSVTARNASGYASGVAMMRTSTSVYALLGTTLVSGTSPASFDSTSASISIHGTYRVGE